MSKICPMCECSTVLLADQVHVADLVAGYKSRFDLNVTQYLQIDQVPKLELLYCPECDFKWFFPVLAADGNFYENIQKNSWYYQTEKVEFDFTLKSLSQGDRVLEIGCGAGFFGSILPDGIVYKGLEFNELAVSTGQARSIDIELESIESHAAKHPARYDLVCSFQVLEHVTDPRQFLESCAEAVKAGGTLVIGVPAENSFLSIAENNWLNMPPHHLSRWTDKALVCAFESLGLQDIHIWHEPIDEVTRPWHEDCLANFGLKTLLGVKPKLVSDRLLSRAVWNLPKTSIARRWLINHGRSRFSYADHGHTVCISGQRPVES